MPKTKLPEGEKEAADKLSKARDMAAQAEFKPFNVYAYPIPNNPTDEQLAQAVADLSRTPDWLTVTLETKKQPSPDPKTGALTMEHPVIEAKKTVSINAIALAQEITQQTRFEHFPALMEGAVYEPELGTWRTFAKGEWSLTIRKRAHDALKQWGVLSKATKAVISDVFDEINLDAFNTNYRKRSPFDAATETHPELVAFKNGTYNILTNQMEQSKAQNYLLNAHSYTIDPKNDQCPETEKLITAMLGDSSVLLEEYIGYMFYHSHKKFQEMLWIHGSGGEGKSTLMGIIRDTLGADNVTGQTPADLSNPEKRFVTAELYGKEANIVADIPDTHMKDTSILKSLTGGDSIAAENKGITGYMFTNFSKQLFAANSLPSISDSSKGMERRIMVAKMIDGDVSKEPRKSKFWGQFNMSTIKRECPRFAMKCMHRFKLAYDRGGFTKPLAVKEASREWMEENDHLQEYLTSEGFDIQIGNDAIFIQRPDFNSNFRHWLSTNSYEAFGPAKIKKRMLAKGFGDNHGKPKKIDGKTVYIYTGIGVGNAKGF